MHGDKSRPHRSRLGLFDANISTSLSSIYFEMRVFDAIHSDNGTTVQGASAEIQGLLCAASNNGQTVAIAVTTYGIKWNF